MLLRKVTNKTAERKRGQRSLLSGKISSECPVQYNITEIGGVQASWNISWQGEISFPHALKQLTETKFTNISKRTNKSKNCIDCVRVIGQPYLVER